MPCKGGYNNLSFRWITRYLECVIQYQCSLRFSDADVTASLCSGSSTSHKHGAAAPPISPQKHYKHPRHVEEEKEEEEEEELDEDSTQCELFSAQLMFLISHACPSNQLPLNQVWILRGKSQ